MHSMCVRDVLDDSNSDESESACSTEEISNMEEEVETSGGCDVALGQQLTAGR